MSKFKSIITASSLIFSSVSLYASVNSYSVNPLDLYSNVTSLNMAFNEKYGKKLILPVNVKDSSQTVVKNSDNKKYMGTKDYNTYSSNSDFAKDATNMMNSLYDLIGKYKNMGFINEIIKQDKVPALMFDIDNTIELTSFDDDYFTKSGINDPATANFIQKACFKDGVECYFITARTCNMYEALATKKWIKQHLHLTDKQVANYVFLSGAIADDSCTSIPDEKVAYKDILRKQLSKTRNVYWLMSIGDQMTDWFGENSGLKVWYPNQMFDSSIVANNHNNDVMSSLKTVVAPSNRCYESFGPKSLTQSSVKYCSAFKADHYIKPNYSV